MQTSWFHSPTRNFSSTIHQIGGNLSLVQMNHSDGICTAHNEGRISITWRTTKLGEYIDK